MQDLPVNPGHDRVERFSGPVRPARPVGLALIAPSGYVTSEALQRGVAALEQLGCVVFNYVDPAATYQRFAATDDARLAQFDAAVANPDVEVVLSVRGGYGLSRLLERIDFGRMAQSGKRFVGHSDFTAFHLGLLAATGATSFAGPMLSSDFTADALSEFTINHLWAALGNAEQEIRVEGVDNPDVHVDGVLWGGNLSLVAHLAGTSFLPKINEGILFLEDVNEQPFRVERMLLQLHYAGVLARQRAIVLGDFSQYKLTHYDNGYNFESMLAYLRTQIPVPIVTGLPFGHIPNMVTLPVGGHADLTTANGVFVLRTRHTLPLA